VKTREGRRHRYCFPQTEKREEKERRKRILMKWTLTGNGSLVRYMPATKHFCRPVSLNTIIY